MVTMRFREMFDLRELRNTLELIITMELGTSVDLRTRKSVAKKPSSDFVAVPTSSDLYCST